MSSEQYRKGPLTVKVADGVAIERHRRLVVSAAGEATHAGATGSWVGVSTNDMPLAADFTDGQHRARTVGVRSPFGGCTETFIASGAITAGDEIGPSAAGKVIGVAAGTGFAQCVSKNVTADGHQLEAIWIVK